jgi:hypothetical protein
MVFARPPEAKVIRASQEQREGAVLDNLRLRVAGELEKSSGGLRGRRAHFRISKVEDKIAHLSSTSSSGRAAY